MKLFTFTNPKPGREDEFNDWYDNQHLADVLAIPGVVAAQRLRFVPNGEGDHPPLPTYLTIYELDGNYEAFRAELSARVADGRIPISEALDFGNNTTVMAAYGPI